MSPAHLQESTSLSTRSTVLGCRYSCCKGPKDGFGRARFGDVFPGIAQAGLVLEAYLKVTFAHGRCEEDTNLNKVNSLYSTGGATKT
jgi:hypothetical protein